MPPQDHIEWTAEKVVQFWDHVSESEENYFTYQFGDIIVSRLRKYLHPAKSVLDFGCGVGHLIPHLLKRGMEVTATDSSVKSRDAVNAQFKEHEGFHGAWPIEKLTNSGKRFDVILVVEVIEHLPDSVLKEVFETLKSLLSKNGVVIFTTPHDEDLKASFVACPDCKKSFHRWQHVRSWTQETLSACLTDNGFTMDDSFVTDFSGSLRKNRLNFAKYVVKRMIGYKLPHLVCVATIAPSTYET